LFLRDVDPYVHLDPDGHMVHQHAVRDSNLYSDRDPDGHVGYLHPNVHTNHDPHADNDKHPNPDLHGDSDRDATGTWYTETPTVTPTSTRTACCHSDEHLVCFSRDVDPYVHSTRRAHGPPARRP
jgi:hypothetical protein